jgi:putative membrane protein
MRAPLLAAAIVAASFQVQAEDAAPKPAAPTPKVFLTNAIQGDNAEIALGHMAENKGATPQTREYGRMLTKDHSAARAEALKVGGAYGVKPSKTTPADVLAEMQKLETLSGKAFDQEFARYSVQEHQKDVAEFTKATEISSAPVANLAKSTLPTLQKHLDEAKKLAKHAG